MGRPTKPWYRKFRGLWYVTISGKQYNLGPDRDKAHKKFHKLMAEETERQVGSERLSAVLDDFLEWVKHEHQSRTSGTGVTSSRSLTPIDVSLDEIERILI